MKECLFTGAEHELSSALNALQNLIGKFHDWAPFQKYGLVFFILGNVPSPAFEKDIVILFQVTTMRPVRKRTSTLPESPLHQQISSAPICEYLLRSPRIKAAG